MSRRSRRACQPSRSPDLRGVGEVRRGVTGTATDHVDREVEAGHLAHGVEDLLDRDALATADVEDLAEIRARPAGGRPRHAPRPGRRRGCSRGRTSRRGSGSRRRRAAGSCRPTGPGTPSGTRLLTLRSASSGAAGAGDVEVAQGGPPQGLRRGQVAQHPLADQLGLAVRADRDRHGRLVDQLDRRLAVDRGAGGEQHPVDTLVDAGLQQRAHPPDVLVPVEQRLLDRLADRLLRREVQDAGHAVLAQGGAHRRRRRPPTPARTARRRGRCPARRVDRSSRTTTGTSMSRNARTMCAPM